MRATLRDGWVTAMDLSQLLGIPEKDVAGHLDHVERSLDHTDERLVCELPRCLGCGFEFTRQRFGRPGKCPRCRDRRVTRPRFCIQT
jgi:predicted Zn-ribbon and HTH transcriptional regulator